MSESNGDYVMRLRPPSYLKVETSDGKHSTRLDVFESWRFLTEARQQPSTQKKWEVIRGWLATKLGVKTEEIPESLAFQFHEQVIAIGTREEEEIKKNVGEIASSRPHTTASQQDGSTGRTT